jgi:hypothetical protein
MTLERVTVGQLRNFNQVQYHYYHIVARSLLESSSRAPFRLSHGR